ncbi:Uncharacterised protein [uncultured archaeon]|nr:Uncharacterised protein [uncultured archaeon]
MPAKKKNAPPLPSFMRQLPSGAVTNMLVRSGIKHGGNGTNNPPANKLHLHLPQYMLSEISARRIARDKRTEEALRRRKTI